MIFKNAVLGIFPNKTSIKLLGALCAASRGLISGYSPPDIIMQAGIPALPMGD